MPFLPVAPAPRRPRYPSFAGGTPALLVLQHLTKTSLTIPRVPRLSGISDLVRSNRMASDKALYTVALAVLALGLGNSLANNQPEWLRSLTNPSLAVAQEASGRAEEYMGMAQAILVARRTS